MWALWNDVSTFSRLASSVTPHALIVIFRRLIFCRSQQRRQRRRTKPQPQYLEYTEREFIAVIIIIAIVMSFSSRGRSITEVIVVRLTNSVLLCAVVVRRYHFLSLVVVVVKRLINIMYILRVPVRSRLGSHHISRLVHFCFHLFITITSFRSFSHKCALDR
jgi:TRAP-type C4-dicarboxylate transport system permease large subunit